jgi:hypothetical protein
MPVFKYFMFVGGALLALLLAVSYVLPSEPVAQGVATASNDQPLIRIRSDRHLPDRVVLDTSQPTIPAPVTTAIVAPQPPVQESASSALAAVSAKARVRETFAQLSPAAPKSDTAAAKKTPVKRKVARAHPAPQFGFGPQFGRPMMVAQQPHFGLFNTTW